MKLTFYDNLAYIIIILILLTAVIMKFLCDYIFKCNQKKK